MTSSLRVPRTPLVTRLLAALTGLADRQSSSESVDVTNSHAWTGRPRRRSRFGQAAVAQVPPVVGNADAALVALNGVLRNVNRLVPQIRDLAGKAGAASAELPIFITQTRATVAELERLLVRLAAHGETSSAMVLSTPIPWRPVLPG